MSEPLFVQQIKVMAPPGFREAIHAAACREGRSAAEFIRDAIRDRLRRTERQVTGGATAAVQEAAR